MKFLRVLAVILATLPPTLAHAQSASSPVRRVRKPSVKPQDKPPVKLKDLVGTWTGGPAADTSGNEAIVVTDTLVVRPDGTFIWNWGGWKHPREGRVARDSMLFTSGPGYRLARRGQLFLVESDSLGLEAQIEFMKQAQAGPLNQSGARWFSLFQIQGEASFDHRIKANEMRFVYVFTQATAKTP